MKRAGAAKFPHSVQLFKFCLKVLQHQRGTKVRDQELGSILEYNPSDCSHWKRGEKNVRSVFALAKLAEAMSVEAAIVHDVASGAANLDEAYFEFQDSLACRQALHQAERLGAEGRAKVMARVLPFVEEIHRNSDFATAPLYVPEVIRFFSFVSTQQVEMMDRLSRILRTKPGQYCIQYRKGELRSQVRLSLIRDFTRILFQAERARFPELGESNPESNAYEELVFAANLLVPKKLLQSEVAKLDVKRNLVVELATTFWVPKSMISFQLKNMIRDLGESSSRSAVSDVKEVVTNSGV